MERLGIKKKKEILLLYGVDGWVESKKGLTTHIVLFFRVYKSCTSPPQKAEVAGCIIDLSGADKQLQCCLLLKLSEIFLRFHRNKESSSLPQV